MIRRVFGVPSTARPPAAARRCVGGLAGIAALSLAACAGPKEEPKGLSVSPSIVDFGQVVVGLLARRTLTLDNESADVIRVIEARPAELIAPAVRLERIPAALAAGDDAEAEVVFAPKSEGTFSGPIRILTDGDPEEVTVEVNGVAVAPFLRAIPEQIDFGRVMLGQVSVLTATISNQGSRSVTVTAITPDTETSDEFEVGPYAIEILGPGESFSFEITFRPMFPGRAIGRLVVGDDSPRPVPLELRLLGEGVDGDIAIEPTSIDFSGALVGEERVRFFEIRNTGTATHTIDAISIDQGTPAMFSIETATAAPFMLRPGEERTIFVHFTPKLAGAIMATVYLDSAAFPARGQVYLFGQTYAAPISELAVVPRAIDFGGVELGSSGSRELTIESPGFLEVHLTGELEIDPPAAPFMLVRAPEGDATFGAFDSHTLEVMYQPQAAGTDTATLRIQSDASNGPTFEVALAGRGENAPSPDADLRPRALELGAVPRDLEVVRTLLLFNGGTAPLSVTSVEITEDAEGRFLLDRAPTSAPFGPGESRAIRIRYSDPLGLAIVETGTVTIGTDDPDRTAILAPLRALTTIPRDDADADLRVHADDLDLHLIRADGTLFDRPSDCCWCNPNPRWADAIAGRPFLDDDQTGPQTIRLSRADGSYAVEIHSRTSDLRTVSVTIELYGSAPLVRTREVGPGQRWRVGTITFSGFDRAGSFTTANLPNDSPMDDSCF